MSLRRSPVVLLDVGFTLTFLDGARVAAGAVAAGVTVAPEAIEAVEARARREMPRYPWAATAEAEAADARLAAGGPAFFARFLELAGATPNDPVSLAAGGRAAWDAHVRRNLWARLGRGVPEAIARLRAAGLRLAVVSNSEGTIRDLLDDVALTGAMEAIIDSWVVGVAKPDPRIFALALERLGGVPPSQATMVGDSPVNDVQGARAAGLQAALLDPFADAPPGEGPVFRDLPSFVDAFLSAPHH